MCSFFQSEFLSQSAPKQRPSKNFEPQVDLVRISLTSTSTGAVLHKASGAQFAHGRETESVMNKALRQHGCRNVEECVPGVGMCTRRGSDPMHGTSTSHSRNAERGMNTHASDSRDERTQRLEWQEQLINHSACVLPRLRRISSCHRTQRTKFTGDAPSESTSPRVKSRSRVQNWESCATTFHTR